MTADPKPTLKGVAAQTSLFSRFILRPASRWLAKKFLTFSLKLCPDIVTGWIQERAGETALQVVLGYLDREGLVHCALCPSRRGPLRNVGPYKACPRHVQVLEEKVRTMEEQAKARAEEADRVDRLNKRGAFRADAVMARAVAQPIPLKVAA